MWIVELGQIGHRGEPDTTLRREQAPTRQQAERIAVELLLGRGISADIAADMARIAGVSGADHQPARTTIRITESH